jgi:hypothetical protein
MTTASRWVRLRTVLGWPIGIALVSWRYMWRTTPLHRSEETGSRADLPNPVHEENERGEGLQGLEAGVGPLLHRSYAVRIAHSTIGPSALIDMVAAKLNQASPEMAVFRKTRGTEGPLRQGDEFIVRMPGPWDGPVRVVHRDAASFRLATLDGHLEAGEIEFRAAPAGDALHFEIESWARAGDPLADLLYNKLRLAKEIQLNMWSHFCVRTAALAGGRPRGGVTIRTRWVAWPLPTRPCSATRNPAIMPHAELLAIPAAALARKPGQLSFEEASAVGVNFITGWLGAVEIAQLATGENIAHAVLRVRAVPPPPRRQPLQPG